METEPQGQPVPGTQQDESAAPAPTEPPAPNESQPEETPQQDVDVAPDADEPGDTSVPEELADHATTTPVPPDNVDHRG